MLPENCRVPTPRAKSFVKPFCLSHGTLECYNLERTRRFYEEFLGLECVRHARPSMSVRLAMRFHVVCVEVGEALHPVNVLNHWGVDVATKEEVDQAHADAIANREEFGIRSVQKIQDAHGVYSFYFEDLDHNWWEIQWYGNGFQHDDLFDFGDRFANDDGRPFSTEEELKARVPTA